MAARGAAGHGCKLATPAQLDFLNCAGVHTRHALLVTVDAAIDACHKAGVAAPLLAALAGVPVLQSHTAPLPQALSLLAPPAGVPYVCCAHALVCRSGQ